VPPEAPDFKEVKSDAVFASEFSEGTAIGRGVFGDVRWVRDHSDGQDYALKVISPEVLVEDVEREVTVQRNVACDQVVRLHKTFRKEHGEYAIMTELMRDGDLTHKIAEGGGLQDGLDVRSIFQQVVQGVKYMHDHDSVHFDLTDRNIWLDGGVAKLGDFGFAKDLEGRKTLRGDGGPRFNSNAKEYLAPELLRKSFNRNPNPRPFDVKAVDIWSLGVTLYHVLSGRMPWSAPLNSQREIVAFLLKIENEGVDGVWHPLPENVDPDAIDLIIKMLQSDVNLRYTIDDVANHHWLNPDGAVYVDRVELQRGPPTAPPQARAIPADIVETPWPPYEPPMEPPQAPRSDDPGRYQPGDYDFGR
jgi:serine/threonine protein kinase